MEKSDLIKAAEIIASSLDDLATATEHVADAINNSGADLHNAVERLATELQGVAREIGT